MSLMDRVTSQSGACALCPDTGSRDGCVMYAPQCVNAVDAYLTSCANDARLSYATMSAYADLLNGNSCYDWLSIAAHPLAASGGCSNVFDYVVSYAQTTDFNGVSVGDSGLITVPYSCLLSDAFQCHPECQASLNMLAASCHSTDIVQWEGLGLPG